jgi:2-polyprenyl-3-methyl-5-hydroxy-6-metoxy-1,4-benzoquinol methylase
MAEKSSLRPYKLKQFKYNSHYWTLKFIRNANRPLRILDIGTADGYLGAILKQQGHYLVGVERDCSLGQRAREFYDGFHITDIEAFGFPYKDEFDYILFADVLEHLVDPAAVLRRAVGCLNDRGEVIISLPNVANLFIRLMLLFGRWEYSDRGILDRTHLHFYTLATLKKMIAAASFRVIEVVPTPLPVQLVFPITDKAIFAPLHELHYLAVRSRRTLLAYQFVVRAVPEPRKW